MSKGIINPKGRLDLNSTSRDLTPSYIPENDKSLGLEKDIILKSKVNTKPFSDIKSKTEIGKILAEIKRLQAAGKYNSRIILWLRDKLDFTQIEAEFLIFKASSAQKKNKSRRVKKKSK